MAWRWPWQRETRESGGDFFDLVLRQIEAQAAGNAADTGSTAAVEAAAGALSRALAAGEVVGPDWAVDAITPLFLGQVGRDLIRNGASMHLVRSRGGMPVLIPAASWHFEGGHDPTTWRVRATAYGPSTSTTWSLPASSVVFVRWGSAPGQPYVGTGPTGWAATTARLQSEAERSLADEASGTLAQLLAVPADGGDGGDDDPLKSLKVDLAKARGKAAFVETTSAGWGEGRSGAPQADWKQSRLGPDPPASMAEIRRDSFDAMLAACGTPPSLFTDADGTSQREALRRWHLGTVLPIARLLEHELAAKLETNIKLKFDTYALDMVSRSTTVSRLTAAGVAPGVALAAVGLADEGAGDG